MKIHYLTLTMIAYLLSSCSVIKPGQAAVKQKLGNLSEEVHTQGVVWYNPFVAKVVKMDTKINDIKLFLNLPSKEGLSVVAEISILYRVSAKNVPKIIKNLGFEYENIIANVFRSASADICAKYFAKDMHSGMRAIIENAIKVKMDETLIKQGIIIETVLMKSIRLPSGLSKSIEQKLQAEQDAMRMKFVLEIAELEAERKRIEAKGTSDAQIILAKGLTEKILKLKSIEAFRVLSQSPNSKIIVTNGKVPFLIE